MRLDNNVLSLGVSALNIYQFFHLITFQKEIMQKKEVFSQDFGEWE